MDKQNNKIATIISCFDWYDKRIKLVSKALSNYGFEVVILTSDFDHINKKRIESKNANQTYISVPTYKKNISIKRIASHFSFSKKVKKALKEINPQLVYCLIPPNRLANVCANYKKTHKDCYIVFDVIDMWPESMPLQKYKNFFVLKKWKSMRDKCLPCIDYLITECDLYYDCLKDKCKNINHSTLYLYKEITDNEEQHIIDSIKKHQSSDGEIRLCYLGSINSIIDIDGISNLIRVLKRDYAVTLSIVGDGESREELINKVKDSGADVIYHGKVFDEIKKAEIISGCDFGINMMKKSITVGLTTKSIDYFCFGLPIINTIKGDTSNFVSKNNIGINLADEFDEIKIDKAFFTLNKHIYIHDFYRQNFSVSTFSKGIESVFKTIKEKK